jgi:hypothetical protein
MTVRRHLLAGAAEFVAAPRANSCPITPHSRMCTVPLPRMWRSVVGRGRGRGEDFLLYLSSDRSDSVGGGSGHYNINSLATLYIIPSPPPHGDSSVVIAVGRCGRAVVATANSRC